MQLGFTSMNTADDPPPDQLARVLEQAGFENVYQLDGGILKYFEVCGHQHYSGDCFVFDKRTALDAELRETETTLCYACQNPLTVEEQQSPHYVPSESCPYCYQEPSGLS